MPRSELALPVADTTCPSSRARAWLFGALSTLIALAALAAGAPQAGATITEADELTRFGEAGSGAGQWSEARALGADPVTGHIYVTETGRRVDEFTPWGNFVKAFGWDVAPGAVDEQQEVRLRASGGTFTLSFAGDTTTDLSFDASEAEVKAALDALPSIGGAGASVNVESVPGNPDGTVPYIHVIAFKGSLAGANVAQIAVANGATALSGGSPSTLLEARTRADGTPGGTGLESCTAESGCKEAVIGGGSGQFQDAKGIAVDPSGNVYVRDAQRVQKFDSAGRFLLTFGKDVNKTKEEEGASQVLRNRCTAASGDVCQAGASGSGDGEFSNGSGLDFASGSLFAGDADRIQRFDAEGNFEASTPVPGFNVVGLAVDPLSGDFYAALKEGGLTFAENVSELDSVTGAEIHKLQNAQGDDVTTTPGGEVFAFGPKLVAPKGVFSFGSDGKASDSAFGFGEAKPALQFASPVALEANAVGTVYVLYDYAYIRAFGPAPVAFEAPPPVAPEVATQYATSVGRDDALVGAEINPNFWTDTRFYVQYGTGKCSEGGCTTEQPVPPGALLTSKVSNKPLKTPAVALEGLTPNTTYHYRFVAESTGGGPTVGEEAAFTTYPVQAPRPGCANDAVRGGPSAKLPDCRGYEMVSPVNKNNGDIFTVAEVAGYGTEFAQGSTDGERFTFSSYRSFADPDAAPYTSQYLARRGVNGWSSEAIMAPRSQGAGTDQSNLNLTFQNEFKAFSADLCLAWEQAAGEPALAPGAPSGYYELYRRENCGTPSYEALAKAQPEGTISSYNPELQGVSADGGSAVFRVKEKLTPEAAAGAIQAYYAKDGGLAFLCVLPNGAPFGGNCSAGSTQDTYMLASAQPNRLASVANALSENGDRAYWTASEGTSGAGKIYLRLNPDQPQSASGCEAGKACTQKVSETVSSRASFFLGASADGSRALFQVAEGPAAGKLFLFTLGGATREIATAPVKVDAAAALPRLVGVVGRSDSLADVYFVSEQVLPETSGASAGEPNLYLDSEGTKTFIATLSRRDVAAAQEVATNTALEPYLHAARASADGASLVFTSDRPLTGYDNVDQATGKPDSEVYLYDATAEELHCVSCNPSGARPRGREAKPSSGSTPQPTAASIPLPTFQLQRIRPLSPDGSRLFFDSFDALLPTDTNGKRDVYEWQAASSAAQCAAAGAGMYAASAGGCLSLISSGESPEDSRFLDATPSGEDVFFTTDASLISTDPGLIDVYDARVGGGFAPAPPPAPCEGESCQGSATPPNDPALSSATFKGAGNAAPPRRCRKGRVMRRGRCVAKRKARHGGARRKATDNRRKSR